MPANEEDKIITNLEEAKSASEQAQVEAITRHIPRWAEQTGAYDTSDLLYLKTKEEEYKAIERRNKILEEKELTAFRLNASRAQSSASEGTNFVLKEKRQSDTLNINVKIKAKKRKKRQSDSVGSEEGKSNDPVSDSNKFDVSTSGGLGDLLNSYGDSD